MVSNNESNVNDFSADKNEPRVYRLDMLLNEFDCYADKMEEARKTGKPLGPVTGIPSLDKELCGALQPGLHVVTGNTGSGKTAFCLQVGADCGFPCLYVSCEMKPLELLRRITARFTDTPLHKLKNPYDSLPAAEMKARVRTAIKQAPMLAIADGTLSFASPEWIRDQAYILKEAHKTEHILVVVDSLHSWAAWLDGEEYGRLGEALTQLRKLSAELNCPVLHISEQSKTANRENQKGKDFGSSAPAGFRGIEYGAESVIGLRVKVDDTGKPVYDAEYRTPVTISFHKNRNGTGGKPFGMIFEGAFQRFVEE